MQTGSKTKVTAPLLEGAVTVKQQEEGLARAWTDEGRDKAKTDAEPTTEVINGLKVPDEPTPAEPQTPPEPAAKAKGKAKEQQSKTKDRRSTG